MPWRTWAPWISRSRRLPACCAPLLPKLIANRALALLLADLPVFIRQSHAERDLAALGQSMAQQEDCLPWKL